MTTLHRANFNALRALLARVEAYPRLSTIDLDHWQCVACDVETSAVVDGLPTTVDTTQEGAVSLFLAALNESGVAAALAGAPTTLRTLADAFPEGITWRLDETPAEPELTTEGLLEAAFAELDAEVA